MRKIKWIIIMILLFFISAFISYNVMSNYYLTKSYVVTVSGKEIQNYDNSNRNIIYTYLDNECRKQFCLNNSWYKSAFRNYNLDEIYDSIKIDETYIVKTIGFDCSYLGMVENIIEFEAK